MATNAPPTPAGSLYRAIWRWHFIIGLLVLPFLLLVGVTGALYLFKPELDRLVYRSLQEVTPVGAQVRPGAMVAAAEAGTGGKVLQLALPEETGRSARLIVRMPSGEARTAFVDPYRGRLLGSTDYGGVMQTVRKLHSLQLFGFWASALIEMTAGWVIVLVATGFILWWPRGRKGGVVTVRGRPSGRLFWRDVHAVTGATAGLLIGFLAVTGMPWSMVWGDYVQRWTTEAGLGQPTPPAETMPEWMIAQGAAPAEGPDAHRHGEPAAELPWAVAELKPASRHGPGPGIGIDEAERLARSRGLPKPFSLAAPTGPKGAWVASYAPPKAEAVRTLYFDQYDGRLLGDVRYGDYGPAAKTISWGIAVHQGQQFGGVNRYLMLAGCLALVALAISSFTMWWKRRPAGGLGVPPLPDDPAVVKGILAVMVLAGLVFPLVGLSLVAALAIEWLLGRRRVQARRSST